MTFAPTWISAGIGGVLIGLSALFLLYSNGKIFGVSGVLGGLLRKAGPMEDVLWRVGALGGLMLAGVVTRSFFPEAWEAGSPKESLLVIMAGFLVGFGTQMGNGCTSGHGICGIGRMSKRSFVAVFIFVGVGMATATLVSLYFQGKLF